jgi:dTDP-4-amino-4,6-dideoxy-D-galactose acyltransferase
VNDIARKLEWDSQHFETTIGRLTRPTIDENDAVQLCAWMRAESVACVYCFFDAADATSPPVAEKTGARFVDVRMTYRLSRIETKPQTPDVPVRLAEARDVEALERIAAIAHHDSRFYFDPRFSRDRVDELYRAWIAKSVRGAIADGAVTFDCEGEAAGYVTFSGPERVGIEGLGEIGLVAVGENARGRGAATALIAAALTELARRGASSVRVVTQGRNAAAQRLYQRAGFTTSEVGFWFHLWSAT